MNTLITTITRTATGLLAGLAVSASMSVAQAQQGTPGIQGVYHGTHLITMRGCPGMCVAGAEIVLGRGVEQAAWTWNFDEGWAEIAGTMLSVGFRYHIQDLYNLDPERDIAYFEDNGDGTYTLHHGFQIYNPNVGNPRTETKTLFRITQDPAAPHELVIETLDGDGVVDGYGAYSPDGIPGTQIPNVFPMTVQPDLAGRACQEGHDACNKKTPGLWEGDAAQIDTIGLLGIEVGDTDSPLKPLWPDTVGTGLDARVASGWMFTRAQTGSMQVADGNPDDPSVPDTTLGQAGLNYQHGYALFTLYSDGSDAAANGAVMTLSYQAALPQKLVVYATQLVDGKERYTLLDASAWRRVDDHTLEVTVQDNAVHDLDTGNAAMRVGIAPVENTVGDYQETSGNGGGPAGWPGLLAGMALIALRRRMSPQCS